MTVRLLTGDNRAVLRTLPDESVHCVVTSPPYWGLRDYGVDGQLGMEPTMTEHIETMVDVFEEVRRVLRKDGTVWLNYGDCYASQGGERTYGSSGGGVGRRPGIKFRPGSARADGVVDGRAIRNRNGNPTPNGLKPKDLCMIPNRIAIALQDAGWWVRSEIIWGKPNPMPESVTDRPATAHEKVFLLTKSAKYWYDADAVRAPAAESSEARLAQNIEAQKGSDRANGGTKTNGSMKAVRKKDKQRGHSRAHAGFNDRWDQMSKAEQSENGRNLRNYEPAPLEAWNIATHAFSEAHFATFPPALVVPCILAGCPKDGVVLDPFGGSGTVGMVADRLGRDSILIELNPEYCDIAKRRIENDAGMFGEITA